MKSRVYWHALPVYAEAQWHLHRRHTCADAAPPCLREGVGQSKLPARFVLADRYDLWRKAMHYTDGHVWRDKHNSTCAKAMLAKLPEP